MNSKISENIRSLRKSKNLTQAELAKRIGSTVASVSAYENNTRLPSYDMLIKMSALFRVSIDNLLGFSSKYTIDVSELTQQQRNTVNEIVSLYVKANRSDQIEDQS